MGTNTVPITIGVEQIRSVEEWSYCGNLVIIDNSSTEVEIKVRTRRESRNMDMLVKIWSNKKNCQSIKTEAMQQHRYAAGVLFGRSMARDNSS